PGPAVELRGAGGRPGRGAADRRRRQGAGGGVGRTAAGGGRRGGHVPARRGRRGRGGQGRQDRAGPPGRAGAGPGPGGRGGPAPPLPAARRGRGGVRAPQAGPRPAPVRGLDGQQVDGRPLEVTGFQVRFLSRSLVDRVRHGLANPTLAFLLVLAAAACLSFEWFQPGFGVAGAAGLICALLAVASLLVLPTNWLALALLLAGPALFPR